MKKSAAKPSKTLEKTARKAAETSAGYQKLHLWNKWLSIIYAVQAIAILVASVARTMPVVLSYLTSNTLVSEATGKTVLDTASRHLFDVNLTAVVVFILAVAAIAHGLMATVYRRRYEAGLAQGVNPVRWIEYIVTASLTVVLVALVSGVAELGLLIALLSLCAVTNLIGWLMERYSASKASGKAWTVYAIGCVTGGLPWILIALYLLGNGIWGHGSLPGYVYWLYGVLGLLFGALAAVIYLQHKAEGKWQDYVTAERAYLVLGLASKTALAWILFAGVLHP